MVKQIDYEQSLLLGKVRRANSKKKTAKTKLDVSAPRGALGVMHIIHTQSPPLHANIKIIFRCFFFFFGLVQKRREVVCTGDRTQRESS